MLRESPLSLLFVAQNGVDIADAPDRRIYELNWGPGSGTWWFINVSMIEQL